MCRRLFRGETDFQILKQIAEGPIPSPRDIDPAYDARLSAIVMKALERDPARRFQTARELQEALEELAHDMRLRMSPLALADYMQALFADKVGAWQKASDEGDVAQLERHFATVMAEREADLARGGSVRRTLPPPSDVQLSSLPGGGAAAARRVAMAGAASSALAVAVARRVAAHVGGAAEAVAAPRWCWRRRPRRRRRRPRLAAPRRRRRDGAADARRRASRRRRRRPRPWW